MTLLFPSNFFILFSNDNDPTQGCEIKQKKLEKIKMVWMFNMSVYFGTENIQIA